MIAAKTIHCAIDAHPSVPPLTTGCRAAWPSAEAAEIDRCDSPRDTAGRDVAELKRRTRRILGLRIDFVSHPLFREPAAEHLVEKLNPLAAESSVVGGSRDDSETAVVRTLCRAPLLSPDLERYLFCRMNLFKATVCRDRRRLSEEWPDRERLERIEHMLAEAVAVRNRIVESNLRLVVSIAKRFEPAGDALDEFVSEGILPLIRAVELFDISRGTRFCTYATHAVRNHLSRVRKRRARQAVTCAFVDTGMMGAAADPGTPQDLVDANLSDSVLVDRLLARLDRRERSILAAPFGLHGFNRAHTFLEIGQIVGLSKERARILACRAVEKLQGWAVPA